MGDKFRRLPSPSMGVAFIALLAALGGTAVALPGSNTVTSGDIVNSQVKTQDIRNSTIRGRDVRADTLTGSDIDESSLGKVPSATTADSATSATNATSATSATNATTATNAEQLGGVVASEYINGFRQVIATSASSSDDKSVTASCAIGEVALGGSGAIGGTPTTPANVIVRQTNVFQQFSIIGLVFPGGFTASGTETDADGGNWTVSARATCAKGG